MSKEKSAISVFQRYLTVWVIMCMVIGILIGKFLPQIPDFLNRFEYAKVSIPMAILIWLMIYPMMLKVDFQSVKNVGKRPKGIIVTCVTNWLIKLMLLLKSYGYVLPCPIGSLAIKTLVGGGGVERTEVAEVRPELVVVEIGWIYER